MKRVKKGIDHKLENEAEDFLRKEDDTYYKHDKKKRVLYSYLSHRQLKTCESKEIPTTSLSTKQKMANPKLSDCYEYEGGL